MYLGDTGKRTLFGIEAVHGKAIKGHSFYGKENEVLLLPGLCVEVTGNLDSGNNLHIVHLKQKRPPFSLLESPFRHQKANSSSQSNASGWHQPKHHSPPPPSTAPQAPLQPASKFITNRSLSLSICLTQTRVPIFDPVKLHYDSIHRLS